LPIPTAFRGPGPGPGTNSVSFICCVTCWTRCWRRYGSKSLRVARWWYTLLCQDAKYQGVRELVEALDLLAGPKLTKAMAFVGQPAEGQVRTNNHVERLNRRLRFAEKVRYLWRKRKWVVRWVVLLLDVCWQEAAAAAAAGSGTKQPGERSAPQRRVRGRKRVA